jgi:hypothetical protein
MENKMFVNFYLFFNFNLIFQNIETSNLFIFIYFYLFLFFYFVSQSI